jgi:hypothetical protein
MRQSTGVRDCEREQSRSVTGRTCDGILKLVAVAHGRLRVSSMQQCDPLSILCLACHAEINGIDRCEHCHPSHFPAEDMSISTQKNIASPCSSHL